MTDPAIADKVYMEPLTLEYIARIVRFERPDAIIPGIGGQTGLNLAMQLEKKGILKECHVQLLGTPSESIEQAEDRELFKELCQRLGEPVLPSQIANSMEEGIAAAETIGYPVVLRPAFTLGGTGGGFADNEEEFREIMKNALVLSIRFWWRKASRASRKSNTRSCGTPTTPPLPSAIWKTSTPWASTPATPSWSARRKR